MSESPKSCWRGGEVRDLFPSCCTTESYKDTLPVSGDRQDVTRYGEG